MVKNCLSSVAPEAKLKDKRQSLLKVQKDTVISYNELINSERESVCLVRTGRGDYYTLRVLVSAKQMKFNTIYFEKIA